MRLQFFRGGSNQYNVWKDEDLCAKDICWETLLAQEFYMLTWLDFLVQVALVFFVMVPKKLILGSGCCGGKTDLLESFLIVVISNIQRFYL